MASASAYHHPSCFIRQSYRPATQNLSWNQWETQLDTVGEGIWSGDNIIHLYKWHFSSIYVTCGNAPWTQPLEWKCPVVQVEIPVAWSGPYPDWNITLGKTSGTGRETLKTVDVSRRLIFLHDLQQFAASNVCRKLHRYFPVLLPVDFLQASLVA